MSVIAENLTIQQGETFFKDFIFKNPDQSLVSISSYTPQSFLQSMQEAQQALYAL